MATTKKRLNITLTPEMEEAIAALAKRDKKPRATVVAELLREAIEVEEDRVLAEMAEERLKNSDGTFLTHKEVWGTATEQNIK